MPFDASLLVEEEEPKSGFDPSLLIEEPDTRSARREKLKAEMVEARKVPLNQRILGAVGALGDLVDPISKMNPLTVIPRAAHGLGQVTGAIPTDQPFPLDEDRPLVDLQQALVNPVVEAGSTLDELRYGAQQAAADVGQFFVTPRGISALAAGGAPKAAQAALAAGFAGSMAAHVPEAHEATKQAAESGSMSDTARAVLNEVATIGAPLAIGAGALRQGLKPAESLVRERIPDARQIREAETVDGPLREQAIEVAQEVPAEVSGEGVPAPTGQAVQGEVLLAPPTPKPSPNEFVPALRRKEGEPIVGKQGQIHQDIYDAQGKMEGQMLRVEQPEHGFMRGNEFVTKEELGNLLGEKGPVESQRLRELQKSQPQVAPKTAVFNGIQMAGPSFKYFNEKTGRWNDVSAETAKQRGIEIPPEELAKAEKALNPTVTVEQSGDAIEPLQMRESAPGVREVLPEVSRITSQNMETIAPTERTTTQEGKLSALRTDLSESRQAESEAVRQMRQPEITDTPQRLQQTSTGDLALQAVPSEATQGRSSQALGIVPPGSGRLMEIIDKAIGKPKEAGPPIKTETDTPLPNFQEHGVSKKIFSQPFGFENLPVLGALFGGTRRLKGHVNESLSTYWAERQIGRSVASALGSEHSWLDKPFEIKDGQITNITPAKEGGSRYISDVFEALQKDPTSYRLNAEQQRAFDAMQKLEKDFSRLEEKHKIGKEVDNEAIDTAELFNANVPQQKGPYFPRIVTSRPEGVTSGLTRGSNVGSKAFFEKPRMFETEAEGWAKGYKYEPSIVNRLATRTERLYKRIADKRLAEDPSLEGVGRKEVEAQLKASFTEELASGEMTEKKIAQMADSIEARGRVYAPAFFNKIFPEETAVQLNKAFPRSQGGLRQAAASVNNALKGLQLGLDLGVGFIQGQALLARHPAIWGKAQFNSLAALFRVEQFPKYVRENLEPVRELAQLGSGVGRLEEYMAGLGGKELLSKVPGVKGFGRQFQTFLDVAKVEMWKAFRETTPKEQWADVAQTLESVLSSGRMEAAGISQKRAMTERALFLAPSYYRGGLNMIAAMAEKGVSGQIARKAMVAYGTAGAVLFYGVAKQLGMSDDEIKERMNPARSDFMMWRIKTKDRISNVGFGGFYRSLLRLMGNTAKTSLEHPENWASLSPDKNPITKWYRGHAGPAVTATWDAFSGKDYMGEDVDISTVARRAVTPITVQAARGRPGQPTPGATEMAGSFVGIQSYPVTSKSELNKLHSDWLANNPDPKVKADYERNRGKPREQSKYAGLITGLLDKDEKAVTGAIKELQGQGVKRSDIYKRFNPYTVSGEAQKPLFHESASTESKFKKSLTPEQLKLYDQARQDRKEQWKLFLKVYRENK